MFCRFKKLHDSPRSSVVGHSKVVGMSTSDVKPVKCVKPIFRLPAVGNSQLVMVLN